MCADTFTSQCLSNVVMFDIETIEFQPTSESWSKSRVIAVKDGTDDISNIRCRSVDRVDGWPDSSWLETKLIQTLLTVTERKVDKEE
jgi:hypothetical protein